MTNDDIEALYKRATKAELWGILWEYVADNQPCDDPNCTGEQHELCIAAEIAAHLEHERKLHAWRTAP